MLALGIFRARSGVGIFDRMGVATGVSTHLFLHLWVYLLWVSSLTGLSSIFCSGSDMLGMFGSCSGIFGMLGTLFGEGSGGGA